jgi:hypothetical protein
VLVAVSLAGTLLTSTDGLEWRAVTMTPPATFVRVRFLGEQFMAVGVAGAIATSPDGWNWVRQESGVTSDLSDLATDGSRVGVVGESGIVLSSENGAVWSPVSTSATGNFLGIAWGNGRWLIQADNESVLWSSDGWVWSQQTIPEVYLRPSLRFEGNRFWMIGVPWVYPHTSLFGSSDGIHWNVMPGGSETGISAFAARPDMTVEVTLPGYGVWHDWLNGAITVTSWSDVQPQPEATRFSFQWKLRSIAGGRGRFVVVGDSGVILVSALIEPVLTLEVDPLTRRFRLLLKGPSGRSLRLEYSSNLAGWSYVGTYGTALPPLWLDPSSGPDRQSGFYRAVLVLEP